MADITRLLPGTRVRVAGYPGRVAIVDRVLNASNVAVYFPETMAALWRPARDLTIARVTPPPVPPIVPCDDEVTF